MPTAALSASDRGDASLRDRRAMLDQLGPAGRLAYYRTGQLTLRDLNIWVARYPDEVPTVNGEVEWIGLRLADLD